MTVDLIQFLLNFVGTYTQKTYTVTKNLVTADPVNGGFNTVNWTYDVIPDGIASFDIEWIARFILLMYFLHMIYKTIKWSFQLFSNASNPNNRKLNLK